MAGKGGRRPSKGGRARGDRGARGREGHLEATLHDRRPTKEPRHGAKSRARHVDAALLFNALASGREPPSGALGPWASSGSVNTATSLLLMLSKGTVRRALGFDRDDPRNEIVSSSNQAVSSSKEHEAPSNQTVARARGRDAVDGETVARSPHRESSARENVSVSDETAARSLATFAREKQTVAGCARRESVCPSSATVSKETGARDESERARSRPTVTVCCHGATIFNLRASVSLLEGARSNGRFAIGAERPGITS